MDNLSAAENFATSYANVVSVQPINESFSATFPQPILVSTPVADRTIYSPLNLSHNLFLKRTIDVVASSILIVFFLSWITLILGVLIKLESKGPVFFYQRRTKRNGEQFTCIKFRSMIVNDHADLMAACKNDERITRLGKFLRSHYLDELPQLLNVWKGDMSLIGPRPYMINENEKFRLMIEHYSNRDLVKPGMTGLAQSKGFHGSLIDLDHVKERVDLDIDYIKNWSFKMEAAIIYNTMRLMISPRPKN